MKTNRQRRKFRATYPIVEPFFSGIAIRAELGTRNQTHTAKLAHIRSESMNGGKRVLRMFFSDTNFISHGAAD